MRRVLEDEGWWVARAAGSLGDVDLVALRGQDLAGDFEPRRCPGEIWLIEVKSTAGGPYERFGPAERHALLEAAARAGAKAWLAYWPPRRSLVWIPSDEWPSTSPSAGTRGGGRVQAVTPLLGRTP